VKANVAAPSIDLNHSALLESGEGRGAPASADIRLPRVWAEMRGTCTVLTFRQDPQILQKSSLRCVFSRLLVRVLCGVVVSKFARAEVYRRLLDRMKWIRYTKFPIVYLGLLVVASPTSIFAQKSASQSTNVIGDEKPNKRSTAGAQQQNAQTNDGAPTAVAPATHNSSHNLGEVLEVVADKQSKNGDVSTYEGYVNATMGNLRVQADHLTFNSVTQDLVAEGNVVFDEGSDQRVTARRAEINAASHRGTFWDSTGFTNRTTTGEYVFFTAARVVRTGPESYDLYEATVTACEDTVAKWSFSAKHAELKMNDRMKLYNAIFRVKGFPALFFPVAWIPTTKSERKSGFLIPSTGSSTQKGRTLKLAYYQTLGKSADITFRGDLYSQRGIGFGAQFRAQTDDESYLRANVFVVRDRILGPSGPDQGGTSLSGEGAQYLPHGWLAVANVSLVSSLQFRQIFSDDISQVINPKQESRLFLNRNSGDYSLNILASNENTALFEPGRLPATGTQFNVQVRTLPEFDVTQYSRRILGSLPIYFSSDSNAGFMKRQETISEIATLSTPSSVARLDFQQKLTAQLPSFGGLSITPSFLYRETFYSASVNPRIPAFNPDLFAVTASDPRLDPSNPLYVPGVKLVDPNSVNRIAPGSLLRHYGELNVDIRPPSLEKDYKNEDGSRNFRHVIEPYITYRLINGIGQQYSSIALFDERDAVANTNEIEYAVVNRFFINRSTSEISRRRRRRKKAAYRPMQSAQEAQNAAAATKAAEARAGETRPEKDKQSPEETDASEEKARQNKEKLETGEQTDLTKKVDPRLVYRRDTKQEAKSVELTDQIAGDNSPVQAYEFLTIKVAQKYFFDRNFGGALIPGQRNQFYPLDTLSGYTFGGVARSFSPVNVDVRYRPLALVYADLRMDIAEQGGLRDLSVSGAVRKDKFSVQASWYVSRHIEIAPNSFEPGTFSGNQVFAGFRIGDNFRGLYFGSLVGYDFTNRFLTATQLSKGRLTNTRTYFGYSWDCCGVQFNYNTFKAGLRNESAFTVTFTLAGIGTFGTDQFSQAAGGGSRRRGAGTDNIGFP
jgi:hypothetical protein